MEAWKSLWIHRKLRDLRCCDETPLQSSSESSVLRALSLFSASESRGHREEADVWRIRSTRIAGFVSHSGLNTRKNVHTCIQAIVRNGLDWFEIANSTSAYAICTRHCDHTSIGPEAHFRVAVAARLTRAFFQKKVVHVHNLQLIVRSAFIQYKLLSSEVSDSDRTKGTVGQEIEQMRQRIKQLKIINSH